MATEFGPSNLNPTQKTLKNKTKKFENKLSRKILI